MTAREGRHNRRQRVCLRSVAAVELRRRAERRASRTLAAAAEASGRWGAVDVRRKRIARAREEKVSAAGALQQRALVQRVPAEERQRAPPPHEPLRL